ncbi:amino acid ABC transporter permease [Nocardia miyunensis]|uniref:amino acid ABC transporter permease n=1 Tax=Nocardia miyunensis TaxID=282684 RepID=UPI000A826A71|nr:amino acid ABC transporter permease [Nocardia miyunensis]
MIWADLGPALERTLGLMVLTYLGALALGIVLAICRIGPVPPLRAAATTYVTVFRNVPLLVLLVLFTFGLPTVGLLVPLYYNAALAMALYWAAFVCEVVRSGVRTVPRGQVEAARALGMSLGQCLRLIILPQALRTMVQPLANIFIGSALATALAAAAGVSELTFWYQQQANQAGSPLTSFVVVGAIYVVIALAAGLIAGRIEERVAIHR